jgi:hypothetical protein
VTLKEGIIGSDDPFFFIIYRFVAPGEFTPVYKSENKTHESQTASALKWNRSQILTAILCKEEETRDIRIEVYKAQKNGNHKFIGNLI